MRKVERSVFQKWSRHPKNILVKKTHNGRLLTAMRVPTAGVVLVSNYLYEKLWPFIVKRRKDGR